MIGNIDFGKIVRGGVDCQPKKTGIPMHEWLVSITFSDLWGARLEKFDGEIREYMDRDGMEEYICIPMKRNGMKISKSNYITMKFIARQNVYMNGLGTHYLTPMLNKDIINDKIKYGFNNAYAGYMKPRYNKK